MNELTDASVELVVITSFCKQVPHLREFAYLGDLLPQALMSALAVFLPVVVSIDLQRLCQLCGIDAGLMAKAVKKVRAEAEQHIDDRVACRGCAQAAGKIDDLGQKVVMGQ